MKVPELKSQYIWVFIFLLYLVPIFFPVGAPFQMSEITVEIYKYIDKLPPGSIVVIGGSSVFAFDLESSAALIPAIRQMARRGLRVVTAPFSVEAAQFERYAIDAARVDEKYGGPWKYGRDYVLLPYMPGADAAMVSFLTDVRSAVKTDVYGTPLDQLPLMKDFRNYKDIALWVCPHWAFPMVVRYATAERGIPSVYFAQAAAYASYTPYMMMYPGKVWMTNGFLGGAQYEKLEGMRGLGHAAIDTYTLVSAAYLIFIILGNIRMIASLREEEGGS
jgi:hypothetical protein